MVKTWEFEIRAYPGTKRKRWKERKEGTGKIWKFQICALKRRKVEREMKEYRVSYGNLIYARM